MKLLLIVTTKILPSGAWEISTVHQNVRRHRQYMGCTKREAIALFRAEIIKEEA